MSNQLVIFSGCKTKAYMYDPEVEYSNLTKRDSPYKTDRDFISIINPREELPLVVDMSVIILLSHHTGDISFE